MSPPGEFVAHEPLPLRCTEPFEDRLGSLEGDQRLVLVPCPPVNLPGGKQRPCLLERHRKAPVCFERRLQLRQAAVEVASGGKQQTPAPAGRGHAPVPAKLR